MAGKRRLTVELKKELFGIVFIVPWLIGFLLLMAVPLLQSLRFSFSNLKITDSGYVLQSIGWENFRQVFLVDASFNRILTEAVMSMILNVPLIIFFSLFAACLLAQKFRGRMLARAIFFLPVVLTSGVIANLDSTNYLAQLVGAAGKDVEGNYFTIMNIEDLIQFLFHSGIQNGKFIGYILSAVFRIFQIVSSSGVQILIFLAGLQSISPSVYEAAKIEGVTGYEAFWKITFPMVTPFILTNTVYSIVDSFYNNNVTNYIHQTAFRQLKFGLSSAMSWSYFLLISIILVISTYFINKKVFYYN